MSLWTYTSDFESGYSAGNLTGQDSWALGVGTMTVTTAQANEGTQSVTASSSANNGRERVISTVTTDGALMYFSLRASSVATAGGIGGIDFFQSTSTLIGQILMNFPLAGDITFRLASGSAGSPKIQTSAAANTWYRIGIEFNFTANEVRCNINNGTFGAWIATGMSLDSVDKIVLNTISDGASYDFFWDSIRATHDAPGGGGFTPTPLMHQRLMAGGVV